MDRLVGMRIEEALILAVLLALARLGLARLQGRVGERREAFYGELLETLLYTGVVVFLFLRPLLYEPFRIPSASMRDTLKEGDRILVNKYVYRFHPPRRGDIVVFQSPPAAEQNGADFVKRLIGLPGDTVNVWNGKVVVNGKALDEPYAREPLYPPPYSRRSGVPQPPYRVPAGHFFMMGDNRNRSLDSRYWGYLDGSRVKGKAVAIFWPLRRMGALRSP